MCSSSSTIVSHADCVDGPTRGCQACGSNHDIMPKQVVVDRFGRHRTWPEMLNWQHMMPVHIHNEFGVSPKLTRGWQSSRIHDSSNMHTPLAMCTYFMIQRICCRQSCTCATSLSGILSGWGKERQTQLQEHTLCPRDSTSAERRMQRCGACHCLSHMWSPSPGM